jgi:hypothetical protein
MRAHPMPPFIQGLLLAFDPAKYLDSHECGLTLELSGGEAVRLERIVRHVGPSFADKD